MVLLYPAGQGEQEVEKLCVENVPAGHGAQVRMLPLPDTKNPEEQALTVANPPPVCLLPQLCTSPLAVIAAKEHADAVTETTSARF